MRPKSPRADPTRRLAGGYVSTKLIFSDEHNPFCAWVGPRHPDCNSFDALWTSVGRSPGRPRRGSLPPAVPRIRPGVDGRPRPGNRLAILVGRLGRPLGGRRLAAGRHSRQPAAHRRPPVQPGAATNPETGSYRLWGTRPLLHRGPRSGGTPSHSRGRSTRPFFPGGPPARIVRHLRGRRLPGRPPPCLSASNPDSPVRCRTNGDAVLWGDRSRRPGPPAKLRSGGWSGAADSGLPGTFGHCRLSLPSPVEWLSWLNQSRSRCESPLSRGGNRSLTRPPLSASRRRPDWPGSWPG